MNKLACQCQRCLGPEGNPWALCKNQLRLECVPAAAVTPTTIKKRREQFVMLPMWWYEKLGNPKPTSLYTWPVAVYVLHLNWNSRGEPFKLANGMLSYDGVDRFVKSRALRDLERRGLISVDRRNRKSPIITVHTTQPT
jgi:hypothetical protein